jgi:hypothetical protein
MQMAQRTSNVNYDLAGKRSEAGSHESAVLAIDLIQRAIDNRQNIGIKGGAAGELYVFPDIGEYLDLLNNRASFFTMPVSELQVEVLNTVDVTKLIDTLSFGSNLDELMLDELLA